MCGGTQLSVSLSLICHSNEGSYEETGIELSLPVSFRKTGVWLCLCSLWLKQRLGKLIEKKHTPQKAVFELKMKLRLI